jgi:hypothetical protein
VDAAALGRDLDRNTGKLKNGFLPQDRSLRHPKEQVSRQRRAVLQRVLNHAQHRGREWHHEEQEQGGKLKALEVLPPQQRDRGSV